MAAIRVRASGKTYPVEIGIDARRRLFQLVRRAVGDGRLFVFYDANFYALHGRTVRSILKIRSSRMEEMVVPSGERFKSQSTLNSLYDFLLDRKIARSDLILACGGGVTTDLAGYAAATVLRGVRWGAVPTTLLGMVDASIGGKTGINHQRGKNMIGAFWPPEFVCSDLQFLPTLGRRHMIAGLGEILKCAGLEGRRLAEQSSSFVCSYDFYDLRALKPLVWRSVELKARLVSRDERDHGPRTFLNFGHTFAHGIEKSLGYGRLLHGEAVILGLYAALKLGEALGYCSGGIDRYKKLIEQCVSLVPRRKLDYRRIIEAMELDKKRSAGGMRFVLLERIGKPIIHDNLNHRLINTALQSMIKVYTALGGKDA